MNLWSLTKVATLATTAPANVAPVAPATPAPVAPQVDPKQKIRDFVKNHSQQQGGLNSPAVQPGAKSQFEALKQQHGPTFGKDYRDVLLEHGLSPNEFHSQVQGAPEEAATPAQSNEPQDFGVAPRKSDGRAEMESEVWLGTALENYLLPKLQLSMTAEIANGEGLNVGMDSLFKRKKKGGGAIKKWEQWLVETGYFPDFNAVKNSLQQDFIAADGKSAEEQIASGKPPAVLTALESSIEANKDKFIKLLKTEYKNSFYSGNSIDAPLGADGKSGAGNIGESQKMRSVVEDDPTNPLPRNLRWELMRRSTQDYPAPNEVSTAQSVVQAFAKAPENAVIMRRILDAKHKKNNQPFSAIIRDYESVAKEALMWPLLGVDDIAVDTQNAMSNWKKFTGVGKEIGNYNPNDPNNDDDSEAMAVDDVDHHMRPLVQKASEGDEEFQKLMHNKAVNFLQQTYDYQQLGQSMDGGKFGVSVDSLNGINRMFRKGSAYLNRLSRMAQAEFNHNGGKLDGDGMPTLGTAQRRSAMISMKMPDVLQKLNQLAKTTPQKGHGRNKEEIAKMGLVPLQAQSVEELESQNAEQKIKYIYTDGKKLFFQTAIHKPNGVIDWPQDLVEPVTFANIGDIPRAVSPQEFVPKMFDKLAKDSPMSLRKGSGALKKGEMPDAGWHQDEQNDKWLQENPNEKDHLGMWRKLQGQRIGDRMKSLGITSDQLAEFLNNRESTRVGARISAKDAQGNSTSKQWIDSVVNGDAVGYSSKDFEVLADAMTQVSKQPVGVDDIFSANKRWYDKHSLNDIYNMNAQNRTAFAATGPYYGTDSLLHSMYGFKHGSYDGNSLHILTLLNSIHSNSHNISELDEFNANKDSARREGVPLFRAVNQPNPSVSDVVDGMKLLDGGDYEGTPEEIQNKKQLYHDQLEKYPKLDPMINDPRGHPNSNVRHLRLLDPTRPYLNENPEAPQGLELGPDRKYDPRQLMTTAFDSFENLMPDAFSEYKQWMAGQGRKVLTKDRQGVHKNERDMLEFLQQYQAKKTQTEATDAQKKKQNIDSAIENQTPQDLEGHAVDYFSRVNPELKKVRDDLHKKEAEGLDASLEWEDLNNMTNARWDDMVQSHNERRQQKGQPALSQEDFARTYLGEQSRNLANHAERLNARSQELSSLDLDTLSLQDQYKKLIPLRLKRHMGAKTKQGVPPVPGERPWDHIDPIQQDLKHNNPETMDYYNIAPEKTWQKKYPPKKPLAQPVASSMDKYIRTVDRISRLSKSTSPHRNRLLIAAFVVEMS
jgi:hypothetical protein